MLTALIIISLLSLLIATEAEPSGSSGDVEAEKPASKKRQTGCGKDDDSDRLAA